MFAVSKFKKICIKTYYQPRCLGFDKLRCLYFWRYLVKCRDAFMAPRTIRKTEVFSFLPLNKTQIAYDSHNFCRICFIELSICPRHHLPGTFWMRSRLRIRSGRLSGRRTVCWFGLKVLDTNLDSNLLAATPAQPVRPSLVYTASLNSSAIWEPRISLTCLVSSKLIAAKKIQNPLISSFSTLR